MSLILLRDPIEYVRPSMLLNPEDLLSPFLPNEFRTLMRCPGGSLNPWRSIASRRDSGSRVSFDTDKFQAHLDVQHFKPEEITVTVSENIITVEGKHEEKEDEHGFISRHFVRRYVLPKGYDINKVESKLSSDGVLSITAPKTEADEKEEQRSIPLIQTGQPSKAAEQKEDEKKEE